MIGQEVDVIRVTHIAWRSRASVLRTLLSVSGSRALAGSDDALAFRAHFPDGLDIFVRPDQFICNGVVLKCNNHQLAVLALGILAGANWSAPAEWWLVHATDDRLVRPAIVNSVLRRQRRFVASYFESP